jgi:phage-related protein
MLAVAFLANAFQNVQTFFQSLITLTVSHHLSCVSSEMKDIKSYLAGIFELVFEVVVKNI